MSLDARESSAVEAGDRAAVAAYFAVRFEIGEAMIGQLFGCDGVGGGKS